MKCLLDTNICIYLIKRRPAQVIERFKAFAYGEIGVSAITVAELQYGVEKSQRREENRAALTQFLLPLVIVDFDDRAAIAYGEIRAALESMGRPIGSLDMLIAAQAASLNVALITNNVGEFSRVPGLVSENWVDG